MILWIYGIRLRNVFFLSLSSFSRRGMKILLFNLKKILSSRSRHFFVFVQDLKFSEAFYAFSSKDNWNWEKCDLYRTLNLLAISLPFQFSAVLGEGLLPWKTRTRVFRIADFEPEVLFFCYLHGWSPTRRTYQKTFQNLTDVKFLKCN